METQGHLLLLWSFDPLVQVPLIATAVAYLAAVRRVDREHPANRVPRPRILAFHARFASQNILDGVIQDMAHVKNARHVWRRDYHRKRLGLWVFLQRAPGAKGRRPPGRAA